MHQYLILSLRLVRRALLSLPPFFRGQFSLPVSEAVLACASPVCLCVFAWLPAKSLEMTTSPLNRGTVKLREVRPPLRCEWVQKALNTTELPRAHIDFLAEARVLGRGNWKRQQGQAGGADLRNCPSPTTAPTAQIYHRCGRMWWRWWGTPITLQPKGAGLCHSRAAPNGKTILSVCWKIKRMSSLSLNSWEEQHLRRIDKRWETESQRALRFPPWLPVWQILFMSAFSHGFFICLVWNTTRMLLSSVVYSGMKYKFMRHGSSEDSSGAGKKYFDCGALYLLTQKHQMLLHHRNFSLVYESDDVFVFFFLRGVTEISLQLQDDQFTSSAIF